jgi:hypothetical protein
MREVALRLVLTDLMDPGSLAGGTQHIPWLLAERSQFRRAGWVN